MWDDILFRAILAALSVVLYVNHHVLHRRPADKKSAARMLPRSSIEWGLVVAPSLWTAALLLYVAGVRWFDYAFSLPQWARWVGVLLMVLCLPLSQWIYRTLGVHFSKKLELRPDHRLVDFGPYRYVRHPMYSTLFLCATATCLISASALVMVTTGAVVIVILLRIKSEESMLLERFGETYRRYQLRTGVLVPKLLQ